MRNYYKISLIWLVNLSVKQKWKLIRSNYYNYFNYIILRQIIIMDIINYYRNYYKSKYIE